MAAPRFRQKHVEKVMLIFPPSRAAKEGLKFCCIPLGVSYLAAALRGRYDVEVLDATAEGYTHEEDDINGFFRFGLSIGDIRKRIEAAKPDVVGVGCLYSPMWPVVQDILAATKSIDPNIATMVGGNHPSFLAEECLKDNRNLDFIVLGEGEYTSNQLLQCLDKGAGFEEINGLAFVDERGETVVQPKTTQIEDLDSIAFPARDLMPLAAYEKVNIPHHVLSRVNKNTSLFTSRGCPARCTFCSSTVFWAPGKRYRTRSVENIIQEIEESIDRFGIREFNIEDDNFSAHPKHVRALLREIIRRKLDITWNTPNGIAMWTLDEELIDLMAESGLQEIVLPFESGDQETLKELIKKPLRLKKAEEIVALIKDRGILHRSFWMIGLPGQTMASIDETLSYIPKLGLDSADLFAAFPLPGTSLAKECFEKGYVPADFDFTQNTSTRGVITTEEFTADEITEIVRKFSTRHDWSLLYRNPARFFKVYSYLFKRPRILWEIGHRTIRRFFHNLVRTRSEAS